MKTRIIQILGVAAVVTIGMVSCDTDACKDVDCGVNGTCLEGDCVCEDGFGGINCETDYCATLTCDATGGVVTPVEDGCDCVCNAGYEGADCSTEERAKFIGTYDVNETCGGNTYMFEIGVGTSSTVTNVLISNFWDQFVASVVATVDGNTITIAEQDPDNDGFLVSGSGTYADGTITMSYTITDTTVSPNDVSNCTATMEKQ